MTLTVPAGFVRDDTNTPPDLTQTPQVELTQWDAWRTPPADDDETEALVAACFAAPIDSWTPEAEPIARVKLDETIFGAASRAPRGTALAPVTVRKAQGFVRDARGPVLVSCFAWCRGARCAGAVEQATLPSAFVAPPEPSLGLRVVLALVHHPTAAACGVVVAAVAFGALAIGTRRRPKRRRKIG